MNSESLLTSGARDDRDFDTLKTQLVHLVQIDLAKMVVSWD